MRKETRAERYAAKQGMATKHNFSFCATYFQNVGNLAYLSRALACFGGETLHIIGKEPDMTEMSRLSGGHSKLIKLARYSNPSDFLDFCSMKNQRIVVAEIDSTSTNIYDYWWNPSVHNVIVLGNEMEGIPTEIVDNCDDKVYIPMPGRGFCLNTSQAGNILAYDFVMKTEFEPV